MKEQNYKSTRLWTILLLVIVLISAGCEKETLINEQHLETNHQQENAIVEANDLSSEILDWDKAMEELSFQKLISEIGTLNSNDLILKGAKKKKKIKLKKSKVKKIKLGDYESYTMLVDNFDIENLSITNFVLETKQGKSNAYIFTYFPTKGWISNYTNGICTDFEGRITIEKVNLDEYQLKSALVCETYFVLIEHNCTAGADHTPDEIGNCSGELSQLPYVDLIEITHCKLTGDSGGATHDSSTDTGSGSSPSGGGSIPDEGDSSGSEPTISPFLNPLNYDISFYETISSRLELSNEEQQWLVDLGEDQFLEELHFFLDINNSPEADQFADEIFNLIKSDNQIDYNAFSFATQAFNQNKIHNNFDEAFINSVDQFMAMGSAASNIDIVQLQIYFSTECAVLRYNHPNWSDTKIYWEASKDIVHITLDVFGMIPVVGEVADLTNGALYLLEGDGVNATLSLAATVPIVGWGATTGKYVFKITASTLGSKVRLTWKVLSNGTVYFGSSGNKLRKVLGITSSTSHAHHLIPWARRTHPVVQKAAKSGDAFHINEALNGIPRLSNLHLTGHPAYNTKVLQILNNFNPNANIDEAYDFVSGLANHIRDLIANNPTLNSGQIANLISYP